MFVAQLTEQYVGSDCIDIKAKINWGDHVISMHKVMKTTQMAYLQIGPHPITDNKKIITLHIVTFYKQAYPSRSLVTKTLNNAWIFSVTFIGLVHLS